MLSESSQGLNEINGLIQVLFDKTKLRELICESRSEWWSTWLLNGGENVRIFIWNSISIRYKR